ncbi:hypothetical protein P3S67_028819 [Capsicum chacoense]
MASSSSATSVVSSSIPSTTPVVSSSVPSAISVVFSTVPDSTFSVTSSLPSVSSTLFGLSPSFDVVSPIIPNLFSVAARATPNVTNLVTIKLNSVEDYLTWRTQFTCLLLSHELMGFVDSSIPPPSPLLGDASGNPQPNPLYRSWIKIDQSVRSWLFATLSRDVLFDIHFLPTSRDIWLSLHLRYMDASQAKSIELKRQLTTLRKDDNISIDHYLRNAKQIADSLAAINAPVVSWDFIDHVLLGLGKEYDTLVGIITHFLGQLSIEELRTKLLLHEQRLQRFKDLDLLTMHQAFAAHSVSTTTPQDSSAQFGNHTGRGRGHSSSFIGRGRGGRGYGLNGRVQQSQFNSSNHNTRISTIGQPQLGTGVTYPGFYNSHSVSTNSPSMGVLGSHPPTLTCQICGSLGHTALQCTNRFNHVFVANDLPKSFTTMFVGETNDTTWYVDSAAFAHMTPSEGNLLHKTPCTVHNHVLVGDGKLLNINNIGYTQLPSTSRPLYLRSVFHVPQLKHNLISVKKLCDDNNCVVNFDSSFISVKDKASGQTFLRESSKGDVYPLSSKSLCSHPQALVVIQQSGDVWHRRLGHCGV